MKNKIFAVIVTLAVAVTMMFGTAATVFAEGEGTVYVTVSVKGSLATAQNGTLMAQVPVKVENGATVDTVLSKVHDQYCPGGYEAGASGWTTKLWNDTSGNFLFFLNNKGLTVGVKTDTVKNGDYIVVSVNADNVYYADWYTYFDCTQKTVKTGETFTLGVKGYPGMTLAGDVAAATVAVKGLKIGTMTESGIFSQIDGKTTNEKGNVELSFDKAGTYYVSAEGTVTDEVTDWGAGETVEANCPIIAPCCKIVVEAAGNAEEPTEPSTPAEPSGPDKGDPSVDNTDTQATTQTTEANTAKAVNTGDDTNIMVFALIAAAAAICGCVAVFARKRHI